MNGRLNFWNKVGHIAALLLTAHVNQVLSQTNHSEDVDYDWSTFLLLVIPVLIILVVLVLCVTGVFMFCLSTLTMNYDQDYYGQAMGSEPVQGDKNPLPQIQLNLDKDLLHYRQSLPVLETVKLCAENSTSAGDSRFSERTEAAGSEPDVEFEQKEEEEDSISVKLGGRKLKQVVIDMEPCQEPEEALCLDKTSMHSPTKSETMSSADINKPSLTKSESRYPLLLLPPSLHHLKLEYYRPQSVFHSVGTVGIRG